jgi:hypothetical protein
MLRGILQILKFFYEFYTFNIKIKTMNVARLFLDSAIKRMNEYRKLGEKTFEQLNDEQMQMQPNNESNSIAIIIHHLHGNMLSRWTNFLTEDGEKAWRNRDEEFELHKANKEQMIQLWNEGWNVLLHALSSLSEENLSNTVTIRKERLSVIDAINRQIAHYSYHVGQIVFLGKWIKGSEWKTLSIARKGSADFNEKMMSKNS